MVSMLKKMLSKLTTVIVATAICTSFLVTNVCNINSINAYSTLYYGIDVSSYQETINWNAVSTANVDFVIIRSGTTNFNQEVLKNDSYFNANYEGAKNNNIKIGTYYFTSSYTLEGMKQNAYDCLSILNGRTLDYPIYIDVEQETRSTKQVALGKSTLTSYLLEALNILKDAGYEAGVYSNKSFLDTYVDVSRITSAGYSIWMAQYPSGSYAVDPTNYDKSDKCLLWQYSSKGSISGVKGDCDVNVSYVDFGDDHPPYPNRTGIYYPACSSECNTLIDALNSINVDSSKEYRKHIAKANDILNYSYTAEQNTYMLNLLKAGKLINPEIFFPACSSDCNTLIEALNSINVDSSKEYRKCIAEVNDISDYSYTAEQNTYMLNLLKAGKLINPDVISALLKWYDELTPVDVGTDFYAYIINVEPWLHLKNNNGNVETAYSLRESAQFWKFTRNSNGSYKIVSCIDGNCLDVYGANSESGTNIQTYAAYDNTPAQKWFIYGESGNYVFRPECSDCVLDITDGSSAAGANVEIYTKNDTSAQQFQIWKEMAELSIVPGDKTNKTFFEWSDFLGEGIHYNLRIWKDALWEGDSYKDVWEMNDKTNCEVDLPVGHYFAYVDVCIGTEVQMSNVIEFTVSENYILLEGDANLDGEVTVADAIILQKWLIGEVTNIPCWQNADLCKDEIIDVFDMIEMRKLIISSQSAQ